MTSRLVEERLKLIDEAQRLRLPEGFLFGAATAAYQIEGAHAADGKGESIWDRFTRQPGVIADGSTGDHACDHYRRWPEDIRLMGELGLGAYGFSVAWSRVQPQGRGAPNRTGLVFYERLVDGLLEAGVAPFLTLYHWDLPQALQVKGGWYNRDTALRFAEYSDLVSRHLGDRVKHWTTLDGPWTYCWRGYATGEDAPGLADGVRGGLCASHHALLGHGLAVPVIRENARDGSVGIALDLNTVEPGGGHSRDEAAALRLDGAQNRWYLDAVFKGHYPPDMLELCESLLPEIRSGDNDVIAAPMDHLGVGIHRLAAVAHGDELPPLNFKRVEQPGKHGAVNGDPGVLFGVHENYRPKAIYVSVRGMSKPREKMEPDGTIPDIERARHLTVHIGDVAQAVDKGIPVKGYFCRPWIDGFEWGRGYTAPSGIAHVDSRSQQRRVKFSGEIYAMIARNHQHKRTR